MIKKYINRFLPFSLFHNQLFYYLFIFSKWTLLAYTLICLNDNNEPHYDDKAIKSINIHDDEATESINIILDKESDVSDDYEAIEHINEDYKLTAGIKFNTWEIAELYFEEYAKQEGFCFRKRRYVTDLVDNTIIRHHTFECSHAQIHEAENIVLMENRRNRDLQIVNCSWYVNMSFPKTAIGIQLNSIIGEYNHLMNPLIKELASRFHYLTNKMLKKIKFWIIKRRLGLTIQYNLLVASFSNKHINKKDLNNAR